ncbi:mediator complex subunit 23-domain-containing protein [Phycomyces nitens]|nr:mediator complex subunit 23-domain-containing protein [Phycomyces nitens]
MESLRNVIARLFADTQDTHVTESQTLEASNQAYYGLFSGKPPKRRRLDLLHPITDTNSDLALVYDNSVVSFPPSTTRINYDALAQEFVRTCQPGGIADQLKAILLKYREPPLTLVKTTRLMTFLHHLLLLMPIIANPASLNTHSTPSITTQTSASPQTFPLGLLFEDLTQTLSLRPVSPHNPSPMSTWIVTIHFMLSCLRSNPLPAIHQAGVTTPVTLSIIKHILLELTRLPATDMTSLQIQCFQTGKKMLDFFLLRSAPDTDGSEQRTSEPIAGQSFGSQGVVSFFDVIYSFPELYGHFLNAVPASASPQPAIANHNVWLMTLHYMASSIQQDHRLLERIPTIMAINIIKHILREINTLPADLTTSQVNCLNKGKELINLFLLGPADDGAGVVSHYDIIVALPDIYGHFLRGTFAQSIHWTMEKFVNELGKRRRHLAFLMMPPDASWPLISQMSRRHEYNDLTTRTSYHMFEGDLIEFVKEGNSTNIETHFRDMLFQRASMDEFRQLVMSLTQSGLDTTQIRKAMVAKVRDVIRCIQHHSRHERRPASEIDQEPFNPATASVRGEDIKMLIPSNMDLWELMTETADQLYSFVAADFFSYEDILQDFYALVYKPDGEPYPPGSKSHLTKDNGLVWLLLQLFYIEKVSTNVIQKDFEGDEHLFEKLVKLYNEDQILSKDAFSLRDLALQCAINHQKTYIKDITNIKHRHPQVAASLLHAGLCYQIQAYFSNHYHSNVPKDSTLFLNLDIQEMTKVAMESQLRQDVVPYTLYVYLVPTKADVSTLGRSGTTYIKGGTLCYTLLDLLSVNAKHSDLGPRYQANTTPAITCVPPHVLDVVYKLLYSAPCSAELMIKEIFEKLRRCDKLVKMKQNGDGALNGPTPFSDQTMRWLHTMSQLMNYRFIRFLKYPFWLIIKGPTSLFSNESVGLLHYIRYSISYLEHRQVYQVLESLAANIMRMQVDVKVLRSLDDPSREKPIWFGESEMLARTMVSTICRLINIRGQADIKTDQIHRVLSSLYEYRIEWSPESLHYFPEAVKSFYVPGPSSPNQSIPLRPAIFPTKVQHMLSSNKAYTSYLLQGVVEHERSLVAYFSLPENHSSLLCMLWMISVMCKSTDNFHLPLVRKLLLTIPPARMATCVIDLMDFILSFDHTANNHDMAYMLLNNMIWKHQWINFNHVIFALVKGSGTPERNTKAFRYIRHLLLESPEFIKRVAKWDSLRFSPRNWTEEDFHKKLMQYLEEFPEYYEFEAFAMNHYEKMQPSLDPPLQTPMPIYLTNVISDFISTLEVVISRLIEHAHTDLLVEILDKYGHLAYYHQYPLSFVCSIFLYYSSSNTLRDPRIRKRILRLLDYAQYDIAPEAITYSHNSNMDGSIFKASYFERVIYKLAGNLTPQKCAPRERPSLPERHFREIGSPAVMGIYIATLEIMLTPIPPATIIKYILDMALLREPHHVGVSALTIHAIGLLISSLPSDEFVHPIWQELNSLIMTDPYLLEVSEPCRLIRCGVPKRNNGRYVMSQSLPDLTTTAILKDSMSARLRKAMVFPYIFNDYTFNLHNYSTNAPNSFLTLFHSILHYSSLDAFSVFLEYMRTLRLSGKLRTDVQLLYICALIGPALHRIEKLENSDADFLIELMHMVEQVTTSMDMKDGWSTQALEQVFDFLHHIRTRFVKSAELTSQIRDIIKIMPPPTSQRLLRLVM